MSGAGRVSRLGMADPDLVGVWGGASEGERARMRAGWWRNGGGVGSRTVTSEALLAKRWQMTFLVRASPLICSSD